MSDPIITPIIGWHDGNFHYSTSLSIFMPSGKYDTASVSLAPPSVDNILNFGKNRWAFVPAINGTYFNPQTGFEVSGSVGITFSTRNEATDWQTAPELNVEAAVLQHLPNGLAFGVAGYAYQQLGEDSGSGAENFKNLIGAKSLEARSLRRRPDRDIQHQVRRDAGRLQAEIHPRIRSEASLREQCGLGEHQLLVLADRQRCVPVPRRSIS